MKKKNHIRVNGQLVKTDKKFSDLSSQQREFINQSLFDEYCKSWLKNNREPGQEQNEEILSAVMDQIKSRGIWIPEREVYKYFCSKKARFRERALNSPV